MDCIDLFAGAGGFSEGARQAGLRVRWAGNHWPTAVACHEANHPQVEHLCQDLHQADWTQVPAHDILLASPACTGHTPARGREQKHHDAARSTAWAVISAAECHQPRALVVENVPAFLGWKLFPAWQNALEALGYRVIHKVLDSQDFGVPQQRRRMFLVALHGKSFRFPELPRASRVGIGSVLDLSVGPWSPTEDGPRVARGKRPLVDRTKACLRSGRARFGGRPFWLHYYSSNTCGYSLDVPVWTLTTVDRYAVVVADQMRTLRAQEVRAAMGFPDTYQLTGKHRLDIHLLGNAVTPPVPAWLLPHVADQAA